MDFVRLNVVLYVHEPEHVLLKNDLLTHFNITHHESVIPLLCFYTLSPHNNIVIVFESRGSELEQNNSSFHMYCIYLYI